MKNTLYLAIILLTLVACRANKSQNKVQSASQPNILFIAVDDLRTELNCYGAHHIQSPNIDRLAASGIRYENAHVQQAICMASRASMLTGVRPERYGIYAGERVKDLSVALPTMNQFFEENGYTIAALGKIYHYEEDRVAQFGEQHIGFSKSSFVANYASSEAREQYKLSGKSKRGPAYEMTDVEDDAYADGKNATQAVEKLRTLSQSDQPFFLSVGFHKPHLPFVAPKKYWDIYPESTITDPTMKQFPENSSKHTMRVKGELTNYYDMPKSYAEIPDQTRSTLRRAYYACVSYVDAQIGKILDELEKTGLSENTIVVLWGDHGYKLGDYGSWCKWSNMNIDTRIPLIIRTPKGEKGSVHSSPVEALDLYPTLVELCGLDAPDHLEGKSLVSTLHDPELDTDRTAFSCWPHNRTKYTKTIMGYAAKTKRYNYVEWVQLATGEVLAKELYDHKEDSNETRNVIEEEQYVDIIRLLAQKIQIRKSATDHDHPFKNVTK